MEDIAFRWLEERSEVMSDIPLPETSDLHLKVGTTGTSTPFSFYIGPKLVGYDVELALRFAAWLLVLAVDAVTKRIDPARRKTEDILKGIRTSAPSGD